MAAMKITWQHVAIVGMVLGAIVTLSLLGDNTSTTAMISLGTLLFIGIGLIVGGQQAQRDQTNGNTTKLLNMVEGMAKQLADAVPAKAIDGDVVIKKEADSDAV